MCSVSMCGWLRSQYSVCGMQMLHACISSNMSNTKCTCKQHARPVRLVWCNNVAVEGAHTSSKTYSAAAASAQAMLRTHAKFTSIRYTVQYVVLYAPHLNPVAHLHSKRLHNRLYTHNSHVKITVRQALLYNTHGSCSFYTVGTSVIALCCSS
jgi:hypothetical protein